MNVDKQVPMGLLNSSYNNDIEYTFPCFKIITI